MNFIASNRSWTKRKQCHNYELCQIVLFFRIFMLLVANELPVCQNTEATTTTNTLIMLNEHVELESELKSFEGRDTGCDIRLSRCLNVNPHYVRLNHKTLKLQFKCELISILWSNIACQ